MKTEHKFSTYRNITYQHFMYQNVEVITKISLPFGGYLQSKRNINFKHNVLEERNINFQHKYQTKLQICTFSTCVLNERNKFSACTKRNYKYVRF